MTRSITNYFKHLSKQLRTVLVGLLVLGLPAIVFAYGSASPLPTYTWPGEQGATTGPEFNNFVNAPGYGDERNFVRISKAVDDNPVDDVYQEDQLAEAGQEYWVRVYVHNTALPGLNTTDTDGNGVGDGVALNTNVRLDFDDGNANGHDLQAHLWAAGGSDGKNKAVEIWDESQLKNDNMVFGIEYVPGSAKALTAKQNTTLQTLSDNIVGSGTKLGQDQNGTINPSGEFPGCFEFATRVYVKVKVVAANVDLNKKVTISNNSDGSEDWKGEFKEDLTTSPDETLTWRIDYKNSGTDVANDITIRDQMPAGLNLVPNSIRWWDNANPGTKQNDTALGAGGMNVGNYAPNGNGFVTFRTTIDPEGPCEFKNVAFVRAKDVTEKSDDAKVFIDKNGDQPGNGCDQAVSFTCDGLTASKIGDLSYKFTATPKLSPGVTAKQYIFTFSDGQTATVDTNVINHTYPAAGNLKASVKIVTSEGTTQNLCEVSIPTTPTTLPRTGPGAAMSAFVGTSALGATIGNWFRSKRALKSALLK